MEKERKLIEDLKRGRVLTRRTFLKYAGLSAATIAGGEFLAACGQASPTAAPVAPTKAAAPTTAAAAPTVLPTKAAKTDLNVALIRWDPGDIYFNGVQLGEELERRRLEQEEGVKIAFSVFGKNDAGAQLTALQAQLAKGVDGVSLVPWRGEAMVPVVTEMHDKGIPCVTHNAFVPKAPQVFVAHDNQEAARKAGQAIVAWLEKNRGADWAKQGGVIIELRCIITASFDIGRHNGYHEVFDPILKDNPDLKWEVRECGCDGSQARKAVDDILSRYGKDKILAVCSIDGTMGIDGAISGFRSAGILYPQDDPRHIPVSTVDSSAPEMQSIGRGELLVAAEQPAVGEGIMTMRLLYQMMKEGKLIEAPAAQETLYADGKEPWMPVQVIPSTDFAGPWYKTKPFVTPTDLPLNDHGHWANIMANEEKGEWPDWTKK